MFIASISILCVRISAAVRSPNSRAFRRSSPSFLSIPPSFSTSSINRSNSSCDIPVLLSVLTQRETNFFQCEKRKLSGVSTQIHRPIKGALNIANRSGTSFAILLGVISPKIKTTIVTTTVETVAPISP